jgi:hypothetical protein
MGIALFAVRGGDEMAIRYGRGDVKQTTTGFRGPLMVQSLTSAKSKFLSLIFINIAISSNCCKF